MKMEDLVLEVRGEVRGDRLFRLSPDDLIDQFSMLEDQQRGNAAKVELSGGARIFVNVQLGDLVAAL
jgi:hypothetical protein